MRRLGPSWLLLVIVLGAIAYAVAEDLTLTTYYPSPRGVYKELRASDSVAIGGTHPTDSNDQPVPARLIVAGSPATDPPDIVGNPGPCPSGTDWYDADADGRREAGECYPTGLLVTQAGRLGVGTTQPGAKMVVTDGDLLISTQGRGLRLRDTTGSGCHLLTVSVAGTISATATACTEPVSGQAFDAYRDADNDSYTIGTIQSISTDPTAPNDGWAAVASATSDCNDSINTVWRYLTGYLDQDNDSYTASSATQVCSGSTLPTGWSTSENGSDCNDGVLYIFQVKSNLFYDKDRDGYYGQNPSGLAGPFNNQCVGISFTSSGRVYYVDEESNGVWLASTPIGSDCYDRNPEARPGQLDFFTTDRGDGSFDYDCNGVITKDPHLNCVTTHPASTICYAAPPAGISGYTASPTCGTGTVRWCTNWNAEACSGSGLNNLGMCDAPASEQVCDTAYSGGRWSFTETARPLPCR